jgi:transmembrane sensor
MNDQILRYFQKKLSVNERVELLKLMENDDVLKQEFIRFRNLLAITHLSTQSINRGEGEQNFHSFFQRIKRNAQREIISNLFKYAAVAVILIASTVWGTLYFSESETKTNLNTLYVPAGQRAQLTLQDGTQVWLNAQSTLKYPSNFSKKRREVEVIGEAFFDVTKDTKRPFIVSTQHIDMQVLGTQFNVYSYPETGYIQTDLVEGSLMVYDEQTPEANVTLKSNEQVIVKDGKMVIGEIQNPDYFRWKEGIYTFENERLLDIIEKLQLYYDVEIIVKDPEIFNVRYTGKFRQRDGIDEILRIIQKIQDFNV